MFSFYDLFSDNDFWFPMNSSASGPMPPCARGHSATFDPDSKSVFVYGGLREDQHYSELYVLDTLTWNWKIVTVGMLHVSNIISTTHTENEVFFVVVVFFSGKGKYTTISISFCKLL